MKRAIIFAWLLLVLVWAGVRYGAHTWVREKIRIHHCPLEWRGPFHGDMNEYDLVCSEDGDVRGWAYATDTGWHASSGECWFYLTKEVWTLEQAKAAVESCQ